MQRVLSFQMGRGFGESSEFVTKRICFSFLFSIGFLCLLGGFLLGRYASDRSLRVKAEKAKMELANNGLLATEHLQDLLLMMLQETSMEEDIATNSNHTNEVSTHGLIEIFSKLQIFQLAIETKSCTIATVCGSQEPDRYVVLSVSGEGVDVALKLARAWSKIYSDHEWRPKRSLVLCVFLGSSDFCFDELTDRVKSRTVAYIAVHGNAARGQDQYVVSGSGMVQAAVLEASKMVKNDKDQTLFEFYKEKNWPIILPRLNVNVPHAVLSFLNSNTSSVTVDNEKLEKNQKILAQIVGLSMWRLSESVYLRWNPEYFNETVTKAMKTIVAKELEELRDDISEAANKLVGNIARLDNEFNLYETPRSLDIRMLNDWMIDLDRTLLCSNAELHSQTDLFKFSILSQELPSITESTLFVIEECFKASVDLLEEICLRRIIRSKENS